jgi:hypothetical protein
MQVSFGPVALHYAVGIDLCPVYHAWRKGSVEKGAQVIAQRWWRTLSDERIHAHAQASLDRLCLRLDGRKRKRDGASTTVGALAEAEPLRPAPAPFAAVVEVTRTVTNQALVAFRGNSYSVPPGHTAARVLVRHRLGAVTLDVVTASGVTLARHRREPDGLGAIVRAATCMRFFCGPKLLVIDEFAYARQRPDPDANAALFEVISRRYLKSSTILTSHTGVAGWGERLGDPMLAAALLDRLLHTGIVVAIDGPSYRMRAHQQRSDALRRALHPGGQP